MSEKILFFGAGALGSLYAAYFKKSGREVSILARGKRLQEIQSQGITLQHAFSGRRMTVPVNVVQTLEPSDYYDLIIVLVRKNQIDEALSIIGKNVKTPDILIMVNNPSGYQTWTNAVGKERLLLGFAGAGGAIDHGVVTYALAPRLFQPTMLAALDKNKNERLKTIAKMFKQAGFPTAISHNMDAWQKTHTAWVSPIAQAIYQANEAGKSLSQCQQILELTVDAIRESMRVLEALEIPITPPAFRLWLHLPNRLLAACLATWTKTDHFKTLILRHSLAAQDEMNQIAVEFSILAQAAHIPTPALHQLSHMER